MEFRVSNLRPLEFTRRSLQYGVNLASLLHSCRPLLCHCEVSHVILYYYGKEGCLDFTNLGRFLFSINIQWSFDSWIFKGFVIARIRKLMLYTVQCYEQGKLKPFHGRFIDKTADRLMLWLSKEINCCRFNCTTFHLPWARLLCCLSKELASK